MAACRGAAPGARCTTFSPPQAGAESFTNEPLDVHIPEEICLEGPSVTFVTIQSKNPPYGGFIDWRATVMLAATNLKLKGVDTCTLEVYNQVRRN